MKNLRISLGRRADATQAEAAICEGFATWSCLESDVQSFPRDSTIISHKGYDVGYDMTDMMCIYVCIYIYMYNLYNQLYLKMRLALSLK